jgi:ASC-1-like (ASCH) protein
MQIHNLKIKLKYLDRILDGSKTFEIRNNDRDFQVGDRVSFTAIFKNPERLPPEEPCLLVKITYITNFPDGIKDGFVVFSFKII